MAPADWNVVKSVKYYSLLSLMIWFPAFAGMSGDIFRSNEVEEPPMAGLKDKRGFIDKDRLDLSERQAVEYWMKRWGVTRDQLTAAHRKVGRMTKDIAAELGKKR